METRFSLFCVSDDEGEFKFERLQNRKIRLELSRLNSFKLIKTHSYEKIFDDKKYLFGNNTPPSNTKEYNYIFIDYSKDLDAAINFYPQECPICFEVMWRDTNIIECFYCNNAFCNACYHKMKNTCDRHKKNLHCPLCRATLLEYYNDQRPLTPLNIESDIESDEIINSTINNEVANIVTNQTPQRNNDSNAILYIFLTILLLMLIGIIL